MLDLAYYELGNVLIRALGLTANDADQLDDLTTILGAPLVMTAPWFRRAAELAHTDALSFYDAAWAAAAAHELAVPLVSADRNCWRWGLAQTPTDIATRLSLPTS